MARSRRQTTALVVLAAGVLLLAVGGVVGAITGDAPRRVATTTTSSSTSTTRPQAAELGSVGRELDELLAAGREVDHHAVYSVTDVELPEGLVQTVEVWRLGPRYRFDIIERDGSGTRRQSSISGGAVSRYCQTINGVETCNTVETDAPDLTSEFLEKLDEADDDVRLRARDDQVAGYVARCFEAEGVGDLCLALDGVMLRVVIGEATVELSVIEDDVPESAFDTSG